MTGDGPHAPGLAVKVEPTFAVPVIVGVTAVRVPIRTGAVLTEGLVAVVYPILVPVTVTVIVFPMVPLVGFTNINNNLFGFMRTLIANEIQRLGLTRRVLALYLRLVLPVMLLECLLTGALMLGLFSRSFWSYLGLLPLGAGALTSLGLWGSLYQAKMVVKVENFNTNKNASMLMNFATIGTAVALSFLPSWWARIALALVITASAYWPIRAVLRNDGCLRRRLWRGIGA